MTSTVRISTLTDNYKREGFAMGYLIFTRRTGEMIDITLEDGRRITIEQLGVKGGQVRYGIDAPRTIRVDRREITERIARERSGGELNGNQ